MPKMTSAELEARIAELEAENARLRSVETTEVPGAPAAPVVAEKRRGRGRTIGAVVLVVIGLLLAPVAVVAGWARLELVDTDRFVQTFAPLADDPEVQEFVSDQVTAAIEREVDIPQLTADLFDGIRALDLPPRAEAALGLLEAPATQGLQSLVADVVHRLVSSEAFADIWRTALQTTHTQFVAAVQGDPDAMLEIGGDGTLSVQIGPIIEAVKERLSERGVGFADAIPVIEQSIVIAQGDAFVLVSTMYALAVGIGTWLPWVALAFLVAGVLVAKRRSKAFVWTAGGFAFVMALLAAGFEIGKVVVIAALSPSIIPGDAASVIYAQLTEAMRSTTVALLVLGLFAALIAWVAGPWAPARSLRGFAGSGFAALRRAGDKHGLSTGSFGHALDRSHGLIAGAIALIAAAVILLNRPVTTASVVTTVLLALLALLILEVLRRPVDEPEGVDAAESAPEVGDESAGVDAAEAEAEADEDEPDTVLTGEGRS
ncbi:hypothetical protein [Agromyces lapidis]|uniref:Integral membrane protein n=1 Tax=Agromyces lapidis TaxID=279574 RepID=A0ABV5SN02_9MICO|nr:hypothetical protein [Agromyces lapidis]